MTLRLGGRSLLGSECRERFCFCIDRVPLKDISFADEGLRMAIVGREFA